MSNIDWSLNKIIMILTSAIIHAALMVGICCAATEQKEKPIEMESRLIKLPMLPPEPSPQPPKPAEPPKTPPPKPVEPPKTPPPKPVEPPKTPQPPKVEPQKPQPPKAVQVKPEQPNINKVNDIRARFNDAKVVPAKPQPPRPQPQPYTPPRPVPSVPSRSKEDLQKTIMKGVSTDTEVKLPQKAGATVAEDSANYAESFASPLLYQYWNPSRAGMKYAKPSAVYITMTVTANGRVTNVQITTRSNDAVMNNSVEELIKQIRSGQIEFPSLASEGINRSFLTMTIGLHLKD